MEIKSNRTAFADEDEEDGVICHEIHLRLHLLPLTHKLIACFSHLLGMRLQFRQEGVVM